MTFCFPGDRSCERTPKVPLPGFLRVRLVLPTSVPPGARQLCPRRLTPTVQAIPLLSPIPKLNFTVFANRPPRLGCHRVFEQFPSLVKLSSVNSSSFIYLRYMAGFAPCPGVQASHG